ncbi:hypothetical protein HD554DRAFT_2137550, partial [Boletus coccyginus]
MQALCRTAVRLGNAVSFHAVSFGPDGSSMYLRRMTDIARDAQNNAPRDPLRAARCDHPLVVHASARYGATRGDVPGHCGVVAKASRRTHAL